MKTTVTASYGLSDGASLRNILLMGGPLSSLLYVAMNIFIPLLFDGYNYSSHTVSELSAINAPTRPLWVLLAMVYILLFAAFGWGVLKSSAGNKRLRVVGWMILAYCVVNLYWPPMHLRGVTPTLTDTLHIVWAMIAVVLMMLMMGFGAAALGRTFRVYTIATIILHIVFGILTSLDASNIPTNMPTPWMGVWERIMIGLFMLWIGVLATLLLRGKGEHLKVTA